MLLLNELAEDGRPFYNDDLALLQTEVLSAATATFPALGSFVIRGCQATPGVAPGTYNISPGLVWLDTLRAFYGAEGVTLPGFIGIGAAVGSAPRPFETGEIKNAYLEYRAAWDTVATPNGIAVSLANPGITYWQAAAAQTRRVGLVEQLATYDPDEYDETGRGRGAARGWHICNGVAGTADLRARFILAANVDFVNPGGLSFRLPGDIGGAETHTLTEAELPAPAAGTLNRFSGSNTFATGSDSRRATDWGTGTAVGAGAAHNNMPPYYVLFLRQWIGLI